jgi:ABC-2 type transport system ATP-binding protein
MLEALSLTKYYSATAAVRNVSFAVRPGRILGYLGANGAGKSTTVKMLTGILEPSDGRIVLNGVSARNNLAAYQSRLGYVPEEAHVYPHLSAVEYLRLVGRLRGMAQTILEPRIARFLQLFGLHLDRHDALSSYSKGMRQKVLLSAAMLHDPSVLILDEPFSGLDVNTAVVLKTLLQEFARQGKMILFSSHVLDVVEKVCTEVVILHKGQVVAYDAVDSLRRIAEQPSLEEVFALLTKAPDAQAIAHELVAAMKIGALEHSRE